MAFIDKLRQRFGPASLACMLWVALCFGMTSAAYLSWLHRLVQLRDSAAADWWSMGAGYLMQAAGLGGAAWLLRKRPGEDLSRAFTVAALLFGAVSAPAMLAASPAAVVCFGLVANLLCGVIAGLYLSAIARRAEPNRRALAFGGGYAIATLAVGLLALVGRGALLRGGYTPILYILLCAGAAAMAARCALLSPADEPAREPPAESAAPPILLALVVVVLTSAVKNMGYSFPSADIEAGLVPELSRMPYALGLAAAGLIGDRNRKYGLACTAAALVLPFIMLGLYNEPVSSTVCWGLDYLFYGFFSVFRAALFLDLAARTGRWALSPLGLLAGRLGDAAGTAVSLLLAGHRVALVAATTAAFLPTVLLLFRLYQKLYEPEVVRQRSEQEVFEAFCLHNDLSARERDVLKMVLDNRTNGEIAEALFITESTVKYHVRNVLQKTGCKNRGELQRKYTLALYPHLLSEETGRA